jgi:hypothetical protein
MLPFQKEAVSWSLFTGEKSESYFANKNNGTTFSTHFFCNVRFDKCSLQRAAPFLFALLTGAGTFISSTML